MSRKAVVLNDTRVDRHHGCATVMETIGTLCAANGIEIVATAPAHRDWRGDAAFVARAEAADLVIVNGEGTIHYDRPAGANLLAAGPWAAERGKPAALVNTTWQANGARAIDLLRSFPIVSVRESASQAELAGHGIEARRIPDLALYREEQGVVRREGTAFCDSVSGATSLGIYRVMRETGGAILPIVYFPPDPRFAARWLRRYFPSRTAMFDLRRLAQAIPVAMREYRAQIGDRDAFAAEVGRQALVVTGRFHMMIFCIAAQTPFLAVGSNTHKIEATIADAGLQPWRMVRDPQSIDEGLLAKASRWSEAESRNLDRFVSGARSDMERLFADIATLAT